MSFFWVVVVTQVSHKLFRGLKTIYLFFSFAKTKALQR